MCFIPYNHFLHLFKTQFQKQIKRVRYDNGTEFFNKECNELFREQGIVHESSCPYTPQQNGVAERKHRHILEVSRVLRFHGHIPIRFWGECVLTAVYLINRLPTAVLKGHTPYEAFHKVKAKLDHLKTLGCFCYATRMLKADKFSPRADACIFLGYSVTQKGYILYNLSQKRMLVSRDVIFKEDIFPFEKMSTKQLPLFPVNDLTLQEDDIHEVTHQFPHEEIFPDVALPYMSTIEGNNHVDHNVAEDYVDEDHVDHNVAVEGGSRQSLRTSHPPIWMKDYVTQVSDSSQPYTLGNYISYQHISPNYAAYLSKFSTEVEPRSYEEAIKDQRWVEAMKMEIKALEDNGTWELVNLPTHKPVIGCKWVFKIKYQADGQINRFKVRLVAKGYNQTEGIDYQETFSLVVKMVTIRSIISLAAAKH